MVVKLRMILLPEDVPKTLEDLQKTFRILQQGQPSQWQDTQYVKLFLDVSPLNDE